MHSRSTSESEAQAPTTGCPTVVPKSRSGYFLSALSDVIEKCIRNCSFESFLEDFQLEAIARDDTELKTALGKMHRKSVDEAKQKIQARLDKLIAEGRVIEKLGELDRLAKQQKPHKKEDKSWRPSGNPEQDTRVHFVAAHLAYTDALDKELAAAELQNDMLMSEVAASRAEFTELENECATIVDRILAIPVPDQTGNIEFLMQNLDLLNHSGPRNLHISEPALDQNCEQTGEEFK